MRGLVPLFFFNSVSNVNVMQTMISLGNTFEKNPKQTQLVNLLLLALLGFLVALAILGLRARRKFTSASLVSEIIILLLLHRHLHDNWNVSSEFSFFLLMHLGLRVSQ